jgi:hypothetical protein
VPSLIQGRIVYCKVGVCDPQGNNPKPNRPFVVITHDDDIKAHERIQAVGITDELGLSLADHYHDVPDAGERRQDLKKEPWYVDFDVKKSLDCSWGRLGFTSPSFQETVPW